MNLTHNPNDPFCSCFTCLVDMAEAGILEPIRIVMLDPLVHTDEHPICDDPECPCQGFGRRAS